MLITLVQKVGTWEKRLGSSQLLVNLDRSIIPYYIEVTNHLQHEIA